MKFVAAKRYRITRGDSTAVVHQRDGRWFLEREGQAPVVIGLVLDIEKALADR